MTYLNKILEKILSKRVFLIDESVAVYDSSTRTFKASNLSIEELPKYAVAILGKQHQSEQEMDFPVRTRKELKSVLKLKFKGSEFKWVARQKKEGGFTVRLWFEKVSNIKPMIRLPLTWLLSRNLSENEVAVLSNERQTFYLSNQRGLAVSAFQSTLIPDVDTFRQSIACYDGNNIEGNLSEAAASAINNKAYWCREFFSFITMERGQTVAEFKPKQLYPALALVVLYLVFSSAYLSYLSSSNEHLVASSRGDVTSILKMRNELEEKSNKVKKLNQLFSEANDKSQPWLAILHVVSKDSTVELRAFRYDGREYTLLGASAKAIDTLSALNSLPFVVEARFSDSVRSSGNKESFNISFNIAKEPS